MARRRRKVLTEQGQAALTEFGMRAVRLGEPRSPTPGRIADRLAEISADLDAAIDGADLGEIVTAAAALRRLVLALDAWSVSVR